MATFGQGINASLGRIDYSPFLQGASQGAQMRAQGMQQLGAGLAQGVEKHFKQQEQMKVMLAELDMMRKADPTVFQNVDPKTAERIAKGEIKYKEVAPLYAGVMTQAKLNSIKRQNDQQAFQNQMSQMDAAARLASANADQIRAKAQVADGGMSTALKDTMAILQSEVAAGKLNPNDTAAIASRKAELLGAGGRDVPEKYYSAGTFVRRDDQSGAVAAVRDNKSGMIGTVDANGKFEPLDTSVYQPASTSDVNTFMDAKAFKDLSDKVVQDENSVKSLVKYIKTAGDLPTGIDKAVNRFSAFIKTSLTKEPLTEDEKNLGISQARQQALLGALRTTVLGPGVLTEIDAQRILNRLGGDILSIGTNPEVVKEAMSEVFEQKLAEYDQNLNVYNAHVAGRYGSSGYRQRKRVATDVEAKAAEANKQEKIPTWNPKTGKFE